MAKLPPAIAVILPVLAADRGRAQAITLMSILGPGPANVRRHVVDIDTALGASSPGLSALADLITKAEHAVSDSRPTVRRQHFISQVVLRQFAEDVPPRGKVLGRYNIVAGRSMPPAGSAGLGYIDEFVPIDSKATELLWQEVEDRLTNAIRAASTPSRLLGRNDLSVLRRAVALHLVRHPQMRQIHQTAFSNAAESQVDRLGGTEYAIEAFRYNFGGLYPAGPEGRRLGVQAAQKGLTQIYTNGGLWRLSVQRAYENVCDRFDAMEVGILIPSSPLKEFLIGDVPVVTFNRTTGAAGLAEGVTVDEADEIYMSVGPRLVVSVGGPNGRHVIGDDDVDTMNQLQIRAANDTVFHRPSAQFSGALAMTQRGGGRGSR